jgi:hypothetical protein
MRVLSSVTIALVVMWVAACSSAALNGKGGTNAKSSSETGKPSEDTEGVPGYLVDPELVTVTLDGDEVKITGATGAVDTPENAAGVISTFVSNAASLASAQTDADGKLEAVLQTSAEVADDGTFTIKMTAKTGDLIVIFAGPNAPATITLPESGDKTNAVVAVFDGKGGKFVTLEKAPTSAKPEPKEEDKPEDEPEDDEPAAKTCAGKEVGGACWYLSATALDSCSITCEAHGGYDEATSTYAGAAGTLAQCYEVLDALGVVGTDALPAVDGGDVPSSIGLGCTAANTVRYRWTLTATNADAIMGGFQRACACKE